LRYRYCCVSVIMRPAGYLVSPHVAHRAIWVWDPCHRQTRNYGTEGWKDAFEDNKQIIVQCATLSKKVWILNLPSSQLIMLSSHLYMARAMAHLAWIKRVCHGRAAFDITFQHKTTVFLKTRNRPMYFAKLPKYYISKIQPIYTVYRQYLPLKATTLVFCTECLEIQVATLSVIN